MMPRVTRRTIPMFRLEGSNTNLSMWSSLEEPSARIVSSLSMIEILPLGPVESISF